MAKANVALLAFNRGVISPLALARTDLKRTALSAEEMTNWMPRTLGSMMLRPGLAYVGPFSSESEAIGIPFVFSSDDTAIIAIDAAGVLDVFIDEALLERPFVSTATTNGTFDTDVAGWTGADESGAASSWVAGGYLGLLGTGSASAIRTQQVAVGASDLNVEHALRVTVERGPVVLRVGSTPGGTDYVAEATLGTGVHSLAFYPSGDFYIYLANSRATQSLVDGVTVESFSSLALPTPWTADDLPNVRYSQSADVVYVACEGVSPRKIERRGDGRSWSLVEYRPEDGPFRLPNTGPGTLTPSALTGNITLTASRATFDAGHVGALFRLTHQGQNILNSFTGADQASDSVRVTGVGDSRLFVINIAGTFTATVTLQRSINEEGSWEDVAAYTAGRTGPYDDNLDNQIVFYRLTVKAGDYTSGTVNYNLVYSLGAGVGVVRVTGYSSATSVSAEVLDALGGFSATSDWEEGEWSDYRGFPTCNVLHEGRLWWAGKDKVWGSESDAYEDFDSTTEGDAGPISRSIGRGPVDRVNWLLPLNRLVIGADLSEWSARSNTFDEPLTPTNFNLKEPSTQGSGAIQAVKIDSRGVFVHRSLTRVYELVYDPDTNEYASTDLSVIAPELLGGGADGADAFTVTRIAVQRQPDTRLHCVLSDGTAAVLVTDPAEDVRCWVKVETGTATAGGAIKDVIVLPGEGEDKVYYVVERDNPGGLTLERWALESECQGGALNKQMDSHFVYGGPAATLIYLPPTLYNELLEVWSGGRYLGQVHAVTDTVELAEEVTEAVIGLGYTARFKSAKLAYAAQLGTALTQRKRLTQLGLVLANTHHEGLEYGEDFDNMDTLPQVHAGAVVAADTVHEQFDADMMEANGTWGTDSRLCLRATAPKPCTVLAAVIGIVEEDKG